MGLVKKICAAIPVYIADGISVVVNDLQIGAVELKDAITDVRAKIAAANTIIATDEAVAVHDPVAGASSAAIEALLTSIDGKVPVQGQAAMAASVPVAIANDQSEIPVAAGTDLNTSALALENGGNLATIAARLLNGGNSAADILALIQTALGDLGLDKTPMVANEPASPGQVLDYPASTATSLEVTVAALTPGVRYQLEVVPADLGDTPASPTDFIRGVFKCDAATGANQITDMDGGRLTTSYRPEVILLPAGSTKVRVHFFRDPTTNFDCQVYLSEVQS